MSSHEGAPRSLQLQPRAMRTLMQAVTGGAHAYILAGTPGAGTLDAARWLAARAVCPQGGDDNCEVCRRVERSVHPDVHVLRAEGTELAIEQIRELVEQLVRRPFEAERQVAVIEDADTLGSTNAAAGNALLKMLEEPPGDVLFLLVARRVAQLLPTLRSRAVEVPFPPLADPVLAQELVARGLDDAALAPVGLTAQTLVRIARGDLGRAVDIANGGAAADLRAVALGVAEGLSAATLQPADCAEALLARVELARAAEEEIVTAELESVAERLPQKEATRLRNSRESDGMEKRVKRRGRRVQALVLRDLLDEMSSWYRDLLAVRSGTPQAVMNADRMPSLTALSATPGAERAVAALDVIEELAARANGNVELPVAVLAMCAELASLGEHRIRSRRTLGAGPRSAQGYELALG